MTSANSKFQLGIGPETTFHSFRHSVRPPLANASADIRDAWIDAVMGHAADEERDDDRRRRTVSEGSSIARNRRAEPTYHCQRHQLSGSGRPVAPAAVCIVEKFGKTLELATKPLWEARSEQRGLAGSAGDHLPPPRSSVPGVRPRGRKPDCEGHRNGYRISLAFCRYFAGTKPYDTVSYGIVGYKLLKRLRTVFCWRICFGATEVSAKILKAVVRGILAVRLGQGNGRKIRGSRALARLPPTVSLTRCYDAPIKRLSSTRPEGRPAERGRRLGLGS